MYKANINYIKDDILKVSVLESLKEVYKHLDADDLDFVQDKTLDFFRNQKLKNAIIESVDILERDGDIEGIKKIIDEAMSAGAERNFGHEYFEMIEDRYSEMARETISTPWDIINDLTQGGLAKGELGVIVAPAGAGKTWILSKIGSEALKNQKRIVLGSKDATSCERIEAIYRRYFYPCFSIKYRLAIRKHQLRRNLDSNQKRTTCQNSTGTEKNRSGVYGDR